MDKRLPPGGLSAALSPCMVPDFAARIQRGVLTVTDLKLELACDQSGPWVTLGGDLHMRKTALKDL